MDKIKEQVKQYIMKGDAGTLTLLDKINELVEENSELKRRLDNHISKHKEYVQGGDPCPNESSDI